MAIDQKLKEMLEIAIADFRSQERNDQQGDLPAQDVADTLEDLAAELAG